MPWRKAGNRKGGQMRSLSVLWLHVPGAGDADVMPIVEHGLSDAFRDFCAEAFNVRMPLEYPPLKLTTVPSPESLPDALFIVQKEFSGPGKFRLRTSSA